MPAGTTQGKLRGEPVKAEPFSLKIEETGLRASIEKLVKVPGLRAGIFAVEPSTGRYVGVDAKKSVAAASMIKIPVLVKLLDAIDQKRIKETDELIIRQELIGGGSGYLQGRVPGTKVSVKEAMEAMIVVSDNTATNLIIDLLGGKEKCNRDFSDWGLRRTYIANWLPDLGGTNKTSPFDLAFLLGRVDKGELLSCQSRERMLGIMQRTKTRTLLPQGIPGDAKIYHKTGDIAQMVGDAGIVSSADGSRYVVAIGVERPWNDRRANELIRKVSKAIFEAMVLKLPSTSTSTSPSTSGSTSGETLEPN